jgi:hypothetical protein
MTKAPIGFDEEILSQIAAILNTAVDRLEEKIAEADLGSIDEAETLIDEACQECIETFKAKLEEIKASAKRGKPDPSSSTYDEDIKKYTAYITAVASGIEKSKSLFDPIFDRIRKIVSTIVERLRSDAALKWNQIIEDFTSFGSLGSL